MMTHTSLREEFSRLLYALIDLIKFEKESILILENGLYDQFLEIESMCQRDRMIPQREAMIINMFIFALRFNHVSIAM